MAIAAAGFLAGCTGAIGGDGTTLPPDGPGGPGAGAGSGNNGGAAGGGGGHAPDPLATPFECLATDEGLAGPRAVKLTNPQFEAAIAVLTNGRRTLTEKLATSPGAPFQDANLGRFSTFSTQGLSSLEVNSLFDVTLPISQDIITRYKTRTGNCVSSTAIAFATCARTLLGEYGPLAFQRPLTNDELALYESKAATGVAKLGRDGAAALAIQMLLMSPSFTFRSELGDGTPDATGVVRLSPYEIAAALSYGLAGYPPDQPLWDAAAGGQLATAEQIRAHARRLVAAGAAPSVVRFVREYLRYDTVTQVNKGIPQHDPQALLQDTDLVVADVVQSNLGAAFFSSLLTTRVAYADSLTFRNYSLAAPPTGGRPMSAVPRLALPAEQRAGVLTQPSWLAGHSDMKENLPVRRGKFIRQNLLCGEVPQLPIDEIPALPPAATLREKLEAHSQGTCSGCHRLMDPLGLPFEQYDHLGRFRTSDNGQPVNATGTIDGTADVDGPVGGVIEYMEKLARSETVRRCMVRHSFRYWMARDEGPADGCALRASDDAYQASGGSYAELLETLFASRSFLYRRLTN